MTTWAQRQARIAADPEFAARIRQHSRDGQRRRRAAGRGDASPVCPFRAKNGNRCWRPMPHRHRMY